MNENLMIPKQVQGILDEVEKTPLYLAELPMEAHPKLPQFNRFIRVINLDAKSENEFVMFGYKQVLKDKDTGEEINIQLPTPFITCPIPRFSFSQNQPNTLGLTATAWLCYSSSATAYTCNC